MTIIGASSRNAGIGLTYYAFIKVYKTIIVMPENMSEVRKKYIK